MKAGNGHDLAGLVGQKIGRLVKNIRFFSKGHTATLYLADLKDGGRLVIKKGDRDNSGLDIEGWMLGYLAEHSDLPVPRVIFADPGLLVMDYCPSSGALDEEAQSHAADLLAALHNIGAGVYGLEKDTLIGPYVQPNTQESDWITFFREHRLLYMARKAYAEGCLKASHMASIEKLAARLSDFIEEPSPPGLIHGDMWSGNILSVSGCISGFIDPALYYADPEIELAFSTLFDSLNEPFFDRYQEHRPLAPGFFEVRRDIYNLYPLLVHVRLFGGGYLQSVERILKRLV